MSTERTITRAKYPVDEFRRWTAKLVQRLDRGYYYIDYWAPDTQTSSGRKRKRHRIYAESDQQAIERFTAFVQILPELIEDDQAETNPLPNAPTIRELAEWYVDTIQPARGDAESTRTGNRRILHRAARILAEAGIRRAEDLATHPEHLDTLANRLAKKLKVSTVNRDLGKLLAVFRAAHERKIIPEMPSPWPRLKQPDKLYPEPLEPEHLRALLERLRTGTRAAGRQSTLYNITRFVMFTGVRPVDACRLTWDRVIGLDTPQPAAVIRQQKTRRLVSLPLAAPAADAIRAERDRRIQSPHVFTGRHGHPIEPVTLWGALRHHSHALGLPRITPRRLRESLVTMLFDAGVDRQTVAAITGHRSQAIESYRRIRNQTAHTIATQYAAQILPETTEHPQDPDTKTDTNPT